MSKKCYHDSYVLKLEKADVYRLPYLSSSGPGFALLEAAKRANLKETASQISSGFASGSSVFAFATLRHTRCGKLC
ncbi:hypothetical protein P3S67_009822 [Capsicum chacoense]